MAKNLYVQDPTRTLTLRNRASAEITRKFKQLSKLITESIVKNQIFTNAQPLEKQDFVFLRDDQKLDKFDKWLEQTINEIILSGSVNINDQNLNWYLLYIQESYTRSINKTNNDLQNIFGRNVIPNITPLSTNFYHIDKLKFLFSRNLEQLRGITQTMSQQILQELSKGLLQGENPNVIAKRIRDRVNKIGITRSKLLARTEIVNTFQLGAIYEGEFINQFLSPKDKIYYEWISGEDDRVRPTHRARDGKFYKEKDVAKLVGEPNCRCSVSALPLSLIEDKKKIQK
jgi:SPP1 gp7 family putative phage head morphogenesis protein